MTLLTLGITFSTAGKLILGLAILMVHHKMEKEHRIDSQVIKAMHKEKFLTYLAIACILVGYFLEMRYYY